MPSTIPMLIIAGVAFVPLEREIPQDLDTQLDCKVVIEKIRPAFAPAALVVIDPTAPKEWWTLKPSPLAIFNCTLVGPSCSARGPHKCKQPGDEWIQ